MAEKNPFGDQATAPKVRARPEAKRSIVPTPGGLPLPPSKQTAPTSPKTVTESEKSSIPTASQVASAERSMSLDLFGLPKFQFAPQPETSFGKSSGGLFSIKSPTHLPKMANLKYPNILGNFSSKAGGSKVTSSVPKPPDFKSIVGVKSKEEFVKKDSEKSATQILPQRPTDLPLFDHGASSAEHTSSVDKSRDHKFKKTIPSTDQNKSNPAVRESGIKGKNVKPSTDESALESNLQAASSAQGASASFQLPESSADVENPEQQDCNLGVKRASDPTPTMPEPQHAADMKRSSESMPVISSQTTDLPKSTSFIEKVKRRLRKIGIKKKLGTEEAEDTTGLMFESTETEQERRPPQRSPGDERRYEKFPTETYNHFWAYDPILPRSEVESKCQVVPNIKFDSPTESNLSESSYKSEPFLTSPEVTYVEESTSKSYTPADELTSGSTPLSLDVDRPSSKSSPASLDVDRRSKDDLNEACGSRSEE